MKFLLVLSLVVFVVAVPEDLYDSKKYDNFNEDEVIESDRLLSAYNHCFLGDGPCTPEGTDFKKLIPEALANSCAKCSESQKKRVAKVIKAIQEKFRDDYAALLKVYDPDSKYGDNINDIVKNYSL